MNTECNKGQIGLPIAKICLMAHLGQSMAGTNESLPPIADPDPSAGTKRRPSSSPLVIY
jgi:hypothetical protein